MPAPTVLICGFTGLSAPSSLALVAARATQLDISWDGGGTEFFRVYYRQLGDSLWKLKTVLASTASTYTMTEMTHATDWEISITRWDEDTGEESSFNARISGSTT